ncbi:MAG: TetR/AcrR family transcriptional regulator [Mycobacteriaceae bacterium]
MSPARRTHAQARAEMREGILRLGREPLATHGAAGLSFREIARGLGVASSAVYRHVSSRDELLTLLVVDAYTELADRVEASLASPPDATSGTGTNAASDLGVLSHSVRDWAVANPARWALLYGTPVPGYAALPDDTTAAGTRVMALMLGILARGSVTGDSPPVSPGLARELETGTGELGIDLPRDAEALAADAVLAWSGLVGTISAEIFGQLGPELTAFGHEFLDRWIGSTASRFGLGQNPGQQ